MPATLLTIIALSFLGSGDTESRTLMSIRGISSLLIFMTPAMCSGTSGTGLTPLGVTTSTAAPISMPRVLGPSLKVR